MKKPLEIGKKGRLSVRERESDRKTSRMAFVPVISSRILLNKCSLKIQLNLCAARFIGG